MTTAQNPFTPMLLTFNPAYFYGRQSEIISILQVVTAPEPSGHAIFGIRTIGKTALLKYIRHPNGAMHHYQEYARSYRPDVGQFRLFFVYISFHNYTESDKLFQRILTQLQDDMDHDPDLADALFFTPCDEDTPRQKVADILHTAIEQLQNLNVRVVFLLDDFDMTLKYIDAYDDRLLRLLSEQAPLIIATEVPISEIRPDFGESSPLLGILRPEAIALLTDDAAKHLIYGQFNDTGARISLQEERFLIEIAGRQPFLLISACELYYNMLSQYADLASFLDEPETSMAFKAQFLTRLAGLPHIDNLLSRTWKRLNEEERQTLRLMASSRKAKLVGRQTTVAARLANKALAYLDVRENTYRIFSEVFAEFVRQQFPTSEMAKVKRSTSELPSSDRDLSPIDSALFDYFVTHMDKVCSYDELLDAVWEDSEKSKRALETAIFRLRKALRPGEEIRNVRGKGYKFVNTAARVPGS